MIVSLNKNKAALGLLYALLPKNKIFSELVIMGLMKSFSPLIKSFMVAGVPNWMGISGYHSIEVFVSKKVFNPSSIQDHCLSSELMIIGKKL